VFGRNGLDLGEHRLTVDDGINELEEKGRDDLCAL
jgi:hypothetical protein